MQNDLPTVLAKLIVRRIFLDFYFTLHEKEIHLRARLGNPAAIQILALDRRFREKLDGRAYENLYIAIAEYRRALLN